MKPLWFFWGQPHMTFLRYLTLLTACQIHKNVVLVRRSEALKPAVQWRERQDFQEPPRGKNYLEEALKLPLSVYELNELAPEIEALKGPDVQTSDLLAWWLLSRYGGSMADMDIVFLKPLPEIKNDIELVVFSGEPKAGYAPVSFMQGRACPTWDRAYQTALRFYAPDEYESCGSICLPSGIKPRLSERIVFPWAGKYPWSKWHNWMFETNEFPTIPQDCCGIHWYAGHNQKYNQAIAGPEDLTKGAVAAAAKIKLVVFSEVLGRCE